MLAKYARRSFAALLAATAFALAVGAPPAAAKSTRPAVRAMIVRPLTLASASDLQFGTIMTSEVSGALSLLPSGSYTAKGLTINDETEVHAAKFKVLGERGQAYSIMLPEAVSFSGRSSDIHVATFIHNAGYTPTLDLDGHGQFNVGATLKFDRRLVDGTYIGIVDVIIANY